MASNLKRSKRTVGKRVNDLSKRVSRLQKNPAPRRIGRYVVGEGNLDPGVIIDINAGADVAVDFYANNNQNSTIPTTPEVNSDGSAITHVINTDSTASITINWNYTTTDVQDEPNNIDGFVVYVYQAATGGVYNFTSSNLETTYFTPRDKRSFVLVGVPADKYYTFGIKAYRVVDSNISTTGVLYSGIVKSTFAGENPFQPSTSISYTGNINGVAASTVSTVATNFNANNDRNATTPTAPVILTDGTAVDHTINTDGSANLSLDWTYTTSTTQGAANNIDGFAIYVYSSTSASAYTFGTTPASERVYYVNADRRALILSGVAANLYYTFGVRAYRTVDSDIDASGVIYGTSIIQPTRSEENPYQPSSTVAFAGDITGTINGTPASTVSTVVTNFNANNDQNVTTPTAPTINSDGTAVDHTLNTDGSANLSFEWNYTTSTVEDAPNNIDGFAIYLHMSPTFSISVVAPSTPSAGSVTYTTTAAHGLVIGNTVVISGLAPTEYNGTFAVTAVTSNTFRVANATTTAVTDATGFVFGNTAYTFGTAADRETVYYVNAEKRGLILTGVAANLYYTLGIRAYRSVDSNIGDGSGVLYSTGTIKPTSAEENPYQPSANVAFGGDITGTVSGTAASTVSSAAVNFNANNDQNSTTPTLPTINSDGTAIDHTLNTDGSANISFEWNYTTSTTQGAANNIDGFAIYVRVGSKTDSTPYTFPAPPAAPGVDDEVFFVSSNQRSFIIYGVSADSHYTFGIRAYRSVDSNIDLTGILYSAGIVQPTRTEENPYRPSATVAYSGNIGDTILTSTPASSVYNAVVNFNSNNDRIEATPNTPTSVTLVPTPQNTNATVDLRTTWSFSTTGDAGNIDGFVLYLRTIQPALIDTLSASGTVVTYTTKTNHGFVAGNSVVISGISPAGYSGTFTVLASPAPTGNTFAVANTTTGTPAYTTAQVYSSTYSATDIVLGDLTTDQNIQKVVLTGEVRGYQFLGLSPSSVYKAAVRAYRVVDTNVPVGNLAGIIFGALANSATATGTVPSIGGGNGIFIGNGKMYIGTGNYANANTGFYVDGGGFFSLKDKLQWNGTTLTIDGNGAFSGSISAATGTFTGNLKIGSGESVFKADSNGIYLGSETFASAEFRVTPAGALTATSANVTGTVTATAGAIGGWDINSSGIYKTTNIGGTNYTANLYIDSTLNLHGVYNDAYANSYVHPGRIYAYAAASGNSTTITAGRIDTTEIFATSLNGTLYGNVNGHTFHYLNGIQFPGPLNTIYPNMPSDYNFSLNFQYSNTGGYIYALVNGDNNAVRRITTTAASDRRVKDSITSDVSSQLEKFYSLTAYEFEYNENLPQVGDVTYTPTGERIVGLIADEVEVLFPGAVLGNKETEYQQVDYQDFTKMLIAASLDQNKRIKELVARVAELESRLA